MKRPNKSGRILHLSNNVQEGILAWRLALLVPHPNAIRAEIVVCTHIGAGTKSWQGTGGCLEGSGWRSKDVRPEEATIRAIRMDAVVVSGAVVVCCNGSIL